MKKSRFSEAQIVGILKELDGGTPATESLGYRTPREFAQQSEFNQPSQITAA